MGWVVDREPSVLHLIVGRDLILAIIGLLHWSERMQLQMKCSELDLEGANGELEELVGDGEVGFGDLMGGGVCPGAAGPHCLLVLLASLDSEVDRPVDLAPLLLPGGQELLVLVHVVQDERVDGH